MIVGDWSLSRARVCAVATGGSCVMQSVIMVPRGPPSPSSGAECGGEGPCSRATVLLL